MRDIIPSIPRQKELFFKSHPHPYRVYERKLEEYLSDHKTVVDLGCGRSAPVLRRLRGRAARFIGVDLVDFTEQIEGVELYNADAAHMPFLKSDSVDLMFCRSVMEHITDPEEAFKEIHRVLKPGGHFVFLTANIYDYASIAAMIVPNRYHARIVKFSEGRPEEDTFPTAYKCNSRRAIARLGRNHGFRVVQISYLGQYPNYFNFNKYLHLMGSLYEVTLRNIPPLHFLRGWILADMIKSEGSP